jgi:hypothetical protein
MAGENPLHQINKFIMVEPPKYLKTAVFKRISEEAKKRLSRRKFIFRSGILLSFVFLGFSAFIFGKEILNSDFWSLASLGFSDMQIVTRHWQEFGLSLFETFPAEAVTIIFIPIFFLLVLSKQYYQNQNFMQLKFKQ